jgi:hypothetical protein
MLLQVLPVHGHDAHNATIAIILPDDVVATHVVLCITQETCAPWLAAQQCGAPFASFIIQMVPALQALVLLPCAAPSAVAAICLECGAGAAYVGICILPTANVAQGGLPVFKMCMMGLLSARALYQLMMQEHHHISALTVMPCSSWAKRCI